MKSKTIDQIHQAIDSCQLNDDYNSNYMDIKEAHKFLNKIPYLTAQYIRVSEIQLLLLENIDDLSFKENNSIIKTLIHNELGAFCLFKEDSVQIGGFNIKYSEQNFDDLIVSLAEKFIKYSLLKKKLSQSNFDKNLIGKVKHFLKYIYRKTNYVLPDDIIFVQNKLVFQEIKLNWKNCFSTSISFLLNRNYVSHTYLLNPFCDETLITSIGCPINEIFNKKDFWDHVGLILIFQML